MRLDHAVHEELDGLRPRERAVEAGPDGGRLLRLIGRRLVRVEHHGDPEPQTQLVGVLEALVGVEGDVVRVHRRLVDQGQTAPRGDLPAEVRVRSHALLDGVLGHRSVHPRERLVQQALRRAVREALDDGAGPVRVLPADPGAAQQLAVDPLRVHVVVAQAGRAVRDGAVERLGRHPLRGHLGGEPAVAADERELGVLGGEAGDQVQALVDRPAACQWDLVQLPYGERRVHVRVDEAGQDEPAAEVHGPRARTGPLGGLPRAPQRHDAAVLDGEGLVARPSRVDRVDLAAGEHQIRLHAASLFAFASLYRSALPSQIVLQAALSDRPGRLRRMNEARCAAPRYTLLVPEGESHEHGRPAQTREHQGRGAPRGRQPDHRVPRPGRAAPGVGGNAQAGAGRGSGARLPAAPGGAQPQGERHGRHRAVRAQRHDSLAARQPRVLLPPHAQRHRGGARGGIRARRAFPAPAVTCTGSDCWWTAPSSRTRRPTTPTSGSSPARGCPSSPSGAGRTTPTAGTGWTTTWRPRRGPCSTTSPGAAPGPSRSSPG